MSSDNGSTTTTTTTAMAAGVLNKIERTEEKLGIQVYLGKGAKWTGRLKNRYSDFIVNEIDEGGNVVHLKSLEYTSVVEEKSEQVDAGEKERELRELVGEDKFKEFMEYYEGENKKNGDSFFVFAADADKESRTRLHKLMKTKFMMATETQGGAVKVLSAKNRNTKKLLQDRYASSNPKYVEFTLCKENRDTMDSLNLLAKHLNQGVRIFSFAGTKDKRGVTTQKVTAFKVLPERLSALNKKLVPLLPPIRIGEFKFTNRQLELGDLKGNRFTVVIRDIRDADDTLITQSVEDFKETGFMNYFGTQRFGTGAIGTHEIGRAVLQGDFGKVRSLLLDPREGEKERSANARKIFKETGDIEKTLRCIPPALNAEKCFLIGLKKDGNNETAFEAIPRTLRMLYTHSYQSFVWNHMASLRIQLYGTRPVVGDLVAVSEETVEMTKDQPEEKTDEKTEEKTDAKEENSNAAEEEMDMDDKKVIKVEYVTQADVDSNRYDISQVVLPLVGSKILYPKHSITERLTEFLNNDGLTLDQIEKIGNKVYKLKGVYRKLIERAADIEYKIINYNDPNEQLGFSDIDILQNKPEPVSLEKAEFKALRISFSLNSSTYATMAYREILKTPSDALTQTQIIENDNNKDTNNNRDNNRDNKKRKSEEISKEESTSKSTEGEDDSKEPPSKKVDLKSELTTTTTTPTESMQIN